MKNITVKQIAFHFVVVIQVALITYVLLNSELLGVVFNELTNNIYALFLSFAIAIVVNFLGILIEFNLTKKLLKTDFKEEAIDFDNKDLQDKTYEEKYILLQKQNSYLKVKNSLLKHILTFFKNSKSNTIVCTLYVFVFCTPMFLQYVIDFEPSVRTFILIFCLIGYSEYSIANLFINARAEYSLSKLNKLTKEILNEENNK